jgi:hypothetical protein
VVGEGEHEVIHGAFPAEGAGAAGAAGGGGSVPVGVVALDAADVEVEEFDRGVVGGEVPAGLGDLAERVVEGLGGVGGVDDMSWSKARKGMDSSQARSQLAISPG